MFKVSVSNAQIIFYRSVRLRTIRQQAFINLTLSSRSWTLTGETHFITLTTLIFKLLTTSILSPQLLTYYILCLL